MIDFAFLENIFLHVHEKMNIDQALEIGCLLTDSQNRVWVGTENGLYRFKRSELLALNENTEEIGFEKYLTDPSDSASLAGNYVTSFFEAHDGTIWIGTYGNGICKYTENGNGGGFVSYNEQNETVQRLKKFTQKLDVPNAATFVGPGKLEEIGNYIKVMEADTVIFDDELSPTQLRNLEKQLECKVLDRTNLILDIFAKRAQTAHAKTQVELAQYQYMLPRLTRMWTHLERQRGGIGMRGPGETQLEVDRRDIRRRISHLKDELEKEGLLDRLVDLKHGETFFVDS